MASILIIDDSAYTRNKVRDTVKIDGHTVLEASDGLMGLNMAVSNRPDCILLDLIMPEIDGLKILRTLYEQGIRIPVIVITADIQVSIQKQCLSLGAAAFINKPPNERELLKALREVLSTQGKGPAVRQATERHIDVLREFIHIGVGRAAAALNAMVKYNVVLEVPTIKVLSPFQFKEETQDLSDKKLASVKMGFYGPFSGTAALVVQPHSATRLTSVLSGESATVSDDGLVHKETLREVGNIVLNGVLGSLGNMLNHQISYSLPFCDVSTIKNIFFMEKIGNESVFLLVRTRFQIKEIEVDGNIILLFTVGTFDTLLSAIDDMQ